MDDVKDKVKGLMKKVNNPFSTSSSGKFKGQGRVLGGSTSDPPPPTNPIRPRQPVYAPPPPSKPIPAPPIRPDSNLGERTRTPPPPPSPPFENTIKPQNPLIAGSVAAFVSAGTSVEIISKLFKNIAKQPENPKFRRIRLSNPKIREAVVEVAGGVELLECVGFKLQEENGEMWAVISDVPSDEQIGLIKEAVSLLEPEQELPPMKFSVSREPDLETEQQEENPSEVSLPVEEPELLHNIDRQVRVFFSTAESSATKIELPESFYSLSATELKREADSRKKQLADSQLLIPKSYKEKKAKEARKTYKTTIIRIQFPDEVVLQAVFLPWEPTTALYEFVSLSLKEAGLEFELWRPAIPKSRVIPRFPGPNRERMPTLEEEELVPSAVIKFKPIETDSIVFTGLSNQLLEICNK